MTRPRSLHVCLALALLAGTAPLARLSSASDDDITQRQVVYSLPGMERAQVRLDHYRTRDNVELPLDVYSPSNPQKGVRPGAVILVHGGPIPPGAFPNRWGIFQSYGRLIAASGLGAVTFTHRLNEASDYPRSAADLSAALEHVRSRAATLGIDPDRLAVWVFSGGGPLASVVFGQRPAFVRCAVLFYSILDFRGAPPVYGGVPSELSPVESVKGAAGSLPPVLVARAGLDEEWINASIDAFIAAANVKGMSVDLFTVPQGHHGFDILDDDARSREVIRAALAFLKSRLAADSRP